MCEDKHASVEGHVKEACGGETYFRTRPTAQDPQIPYGDERHTRLPRMPPGEAAQRSIRSGLLTYL
jgi:hypothetical protein